MARIWNPWRGCQRLSEGCRFCYIHKGDAKRGVDTSCIVKLKSFYAPIQKLRNGEYRIKPGELVYLCFQSDFLLAEADEWRGECWKMIKERSDLTFLFLTKRIDHLSSVLPPDWDSGYDNLIIGVSVEDQKSADYRLAILKELRIKHKNIILQPMLESIDIRKYLDGVEVVVVGGESDREGRILDYSWVLSVMEQCIEHGVRFEFRQLGTHFLKDGKLYHIRTQDLCSQARKAGIDYTPST